MRKEDRKLVVVSSIVIAIMAITFQVMLNNAFKPEDRKAEKNLVAPFTVTLPAGQAADSALAELYSEENPEGQVLKGLDVPHRSDDHIAAWLQRAIPEIMDTDAAGYEKNLEHLATGMNALALKEYQAFMQDSNILETLRNSGLKIRSFVESVPLMLNKGSVGGRYRWLYEAPVTMTFLEPEATYKKTDPVNRHVIVQLQVGRAEEGSGVDEMIIETFRVRSNPAYQD